MLLIKELKILLERKMFMIKCNECEYNKKIMCGKISYNICLKDKEERIIDRKQLKNRPKWCWYRYNSEYVDLTKEKRCN